MRTALGLLLFLASAALMAADEPCPDAWGERGLGPIMIRSESPAQSLRLTPMPRDPNLLCPGEHEFRVMANAVSIWARELGAHPYLLDFHMLDTRVAVGGGLARGWSYELAYNDRRLVDAGLDGITFAFHDLFGYENSGHDAAPRNDIRISIPEYGVEMTPEEYELYVRSLELTLSRQLIAPHAVLPTTAVSLTVRKAPDGESPFEQGDVDYGLELNLAKRFGRNHVYTNLGYTWFGTDRFNAVPLERQQFTGMIAYEWRVTPDQSLLAQYLYSEAVIAAELGGLSEPSHEIYLGYKWRLEKAVLELGLVENIVNYNNSPDFGIATGLVYKF